MMIEPGEIPMNREVGNYVAMFWAPTLPPILKGPLNRLLLWARGTGACMQR
jgi:hypothetical protein